MVSDANYCNVSETVIVEGPDSMDKILTFDFHFILLINLGSLGGSIADIEDALCSYNVTSYTIEATDGTPPYLYSVCVHFYSKETCSDCYKD